MVSDTFDEIPEFEASESNLLVMFV